MPTQTFNSKLLLVAIFITLLAIVAKSLLPKKTLSLVPSKPDANYFLTDIDPKKVYWVNKDKFHFHCVFTETDENLPCTLMFMLTDGEFTGTNLQQFSDIKFDIKYKGDAKRLRLSIRSFDPQFSTKEDSNSTKFNYINLRTRDLDAPIVIGLNELMVADWWISQMNLPREQTHPDFRNALLFSIDFEGNLKGTRHDVQINHVEFVGEWISTEHWYLEIILVWVFFGGVFTLIHLIRLQRSEEQHRNKISTLVMTNSQLRSQTDKFRKLSTVDSLTNAFNRYGIEQIIESLQSQSLSVSIIMLDVDHFKRINDRRGHDVGDKVLQKISEVVQNNVRATDKFGRWGGEEFILVCPNTTITMATTLAEKLRLAIFGTVFESSDPIAVTASFGVTEILPNEPFSETFKRADSALYSAKAMGRNCVVASEHYMPN